MILTSDRWRTVRYRPALTAVALTLVSVLWVEASEPLVVATSLRPLSEDHSLASVTCYICIVWWLLLRSLGYVTNRLQGDSTISPLPGALILVDTPIKRLLVALLVFSFTYRAYGIFWGLPPFDVAIYHPDEPKVIWGAVDFPSDISERTDLRYPTGFHYLIALLSWPFVEILGQSAGMTKFEATHLIGRTISILMGTLSVGFTYLLSKKLLEGV